MTLVEKSLESTFSEFETHNMSHYMWSDSNITTKYVRISGGKCGGETNLKTCGQTRRLSNQTYLKFICYDFIWKFLNNKKQRPKSQDIGIGVSISTHETLFLFLIYSFSFHFILSFTFTWSRNFSVCFLSLSSSIFLFCYLTTCPLHLISLYSQFYSYSEWKIYKLNHLLLIT